MYTQVCICVFACMCVSTCWPWVRFLAGRGPGDSQTEKIAKKNLVY